MHVVYTLGSSLGRDLQWYHLNLFHLAQRTLSRKPRNKAASFDAKVWIAVCPPDSHVGTQRPNVMVSGKGFGPGGRALMNMGSVRRDPTELPSHFYQVRTQDRTASWTAALALLRSHPELGCSASRAGRPEFLLFISYPGCGVCYRGPNKPTEISFSFQWWVRGEKWLGPQVRARGLWRSTDPGHGTQRMSKSGGHLCSLQVEDLRWGPLNTRGGRTWPEAGQPGPWGERGRFVRGGA